MDLKKIPRVVADNHVADSRHAVTRPSAHFSHRATTLQRAESTKCPPIRLARKVWPAFRQLRQPFRAEISLR
jgi:hypothetical protein